MTTSSCRRGAIIYRTFIVVYFVLRFIRQRRGYSSAEYVSNALGIFSDSVAYDLYEDERDDALRFLDQAGEHPLVPQLQALIQGAPTVPGPPPSPARRLVEWAERGYDPVSGEVWLQRTIVGIFFAYAVLNLSSILVIVFLIARYDLPSRSVRQPARSRPRPSLPGRSGRRAELRQAPLEQAPLDIVVDQSQRPAIGVARVLHSPEAPQQFPPRRVQVAVILQAEAIDDLQARLRPLLLGHRDGPAQLDNG